MTDNKPILSNEQIIPAAEAENFPELKELVTLNEEVVDIPDFFTRHNRELNFTIMEITSSSNNLIVYL